MTAIKWESVEAAAFEQMVACLLGHLYPTSQRIDGSGGDAGRDCQVATENGLIAFELKSFTGRMSGSRRSQVARSLGRAALLKPARWLLLVPIDHTPKELEWFDRLRLTVSFPIEWRGRTWLDAQFAERECIRSYYLGDTKEEVFDLLRQLQAEEAGFEDGVPGVVARIQRLVDRANELDPHYKFAIAADGTVATVTVIPRYVGAEKDRPITVSAEFAFPVATEDGRARMAEFERALDFGIPIELASTFVPSLTVEAPAGLGGSFKGATIAMGPGGPATKEPVDLVFTVTNPSGDSMSELPFRLNPQSSGRRGSVLVGTDRSGCVEANLVVDVVKRTYKVRFDIRPATFVPHEFAPAARFFSAFHAPNLFVVATRDGDHTTDPFPCAAEPLVPVELASFVLDLALIQASIGVVCEVSGEITPVDAANAAGGAALVRGQEAEFPWTSADVRLDSSAPLVTRHHMAYETLPLELTVDGPFVISVCGALYRLGRRHLIRISARVAGSSLPDLLADPLAENVRITLVPDPGTLGTVRLLK